MSLNSGAYVRGGTYNSIIGSEGMGESNPSMRPVFFLFPRKNNAKGVYEDVEMVQIHMGGDTKSAPVRRVTENIIRKYPHEYAQFKAGIEQTPQGTPIEKLFGKTSATLNFQAKNIYTVEALAALSDSQLQELGMGGRSMKERAEAFLASQAKTQAVEAKEAEERRFKEELGKRDDVIAALMARLDAVEGAVTAPAKPAPAEPARRGPGRPPKSDNPDALAASLAATAGALAGSEAA